MDEIEISEPELVVGNYYPKYSTKNFVAQRLIDDFVKTFISLIAPLDVATCFDAGSGEGFLLKHLNEQLPNLRVFSSDISYKMQLLAKQNTLSGGVVATAGRLPLSDDSVDLVTMCEVLEHLLDPEMALEEIRRVTRRFCVLSVPNEPIWRIMNVARFSYLSDFGNTPGHIQHWSENGFRKLVGKYFKIVNVKKPLPWIFITGEK